MKIAIVDAYSTGRTLAAFLRERGARLVHVAGPLHSPSYFVRGFDPGVYEALLECGSDLRDTARELDALGVRQVVAGSESGVLAADRLAALLGLPGNHTRTAAARRDKTLMMLAAGREGVTVPRGRAVDDVAAAVAWFAESGVDEAVVKPPSSAGSDNVHFCTSAGEVAAAAEAVLAAYDLYGQANRQALIQERMRGVEYYLNSVSLGGEHRFPEIWRYTKNVSADGVPTYDFEVPVEVGSVEGARLTAFTRRALDALGVAHGAAHTEVMLTDSGEPVLIECGARVGGGTLPAVVAKYLGASQTGLLADMLTDPGSFKAFDETAFSRTHALRNVALINRHAGTVRSTEWVEHVEALPSFVALAHATTPGAHLERTTSLMNSPGFVFLAAVDPADVERDYAALRALEEQSLYTR